MNNGWMMDMPISIKSVKLANELLGDPHENIAAKAKAWKTQRFKVYGKLIEDQVGLELDIMTWFDHTFLVAAVTPTLFARAVYLRKYGTRVVACFPRYTTRVKDVGVTTANKNVYRW